MPNTNKTSGRAAIVVPEGIIFQSQSAYVALRKMLVENRAQLVQLIFSLLVIVFLIFAPDGVAGLARKLKNRIAAWRQRS